MSDLRSQYILFEMPSNLVLAKFKHPSYYMGIIVTAWGLVMLCSGFVRNLAGLAATRVLIGLFESGFFPGAIWLISQWYPPYKTQLRTSIFYFASAFSGAFSGILAAGISQMDGLGGLEGWRWIFVLEGLASVLLGISCFFLLPDTPSLSKWLKPEEQRFLNVIHHATRGSPIEKLAQNKSAKKPFNWSVLWQVLSDKHIYLQALVCAYYVALKTRSKEDG
jgi:MFS family permease